MTIMEHNYKENHNDIRVNTIYTISATYTSHEVEVTNKGVPSKHGEYHNAVEKWHTFKIKNWIVLKANHNSPK